MTRAWRLSHTPSVQPLIKRNSTMTTVAEVRLVGQKPGPLKVWGIGPKFKGDELENLTSVSV